MKKDPKRSGGANLNAQGNINVGGDVVGRDKITNIYPFEGGEVADILWAILGHLSTLPQAEPNRRLFEDHIAPIYEQLKAVLKDYRATIAEIENQLVNSEPIEHIIQQLERRRENLADVREEILSYSQLLRSEFADTTGQLDSLAGFTSAVVEFLTSEPVTGRPRSPTRLSSLIQALDSLRSNKASRHEYLEAVDNQAEAINASWPMVMHRYLDLRIRCLK